MVPYQGENALYRHGPIRVAKDGRHFAHADGTPFFWLGDTWWKCLCKRMTWEGFQELTADRKAKGFTVVQIVCGPYPDEGFLEPRLENEGGLPYESMISKVVNPKYFDYADRRIEASDRCWHCCRRSSAPGGVETATAWRRLASTG